MIFSLHAALQSSLPDHKLRSRRQKIAILPIGLLVIGAFLWLGTPQQGSADPGSRGGDRPFILPFAGDPGPDNWLFIQPYGNTTFAYKYRNSVYYGGQGLHFGIDLAAPCGTPVLSIGDGVVHSIDSWHGAGPHNLMIFHPSGYASFYGHLLVRAKLQIGQKVKAGEIVGLSGDPDRTCNSRPHLHLEIRDVDTQAIAYNPIELIDADWDRIALYGVTPVQFEQDLDNPRQWTDMYDQPLTKFGYGLLNEYEHPWPYDW